jgi:hypothetical protein
LLEAIAARLLQESELLADDLQLLARQHGIEATPPHRKVSQV